MMRAYFVGAAPCFSRGRRFCTAASIPLAAFARQGVADANGQSFESDIQRITHRLPRAMSCSLKWMLLLAALSGAFAVDARADKSTVCTITVNSPDEKE